MNSIEKGIIKFISDYAQSLDNYQQEKDWIIQRLLKSKQVQQVIINCLLSLYPIIQQELSQKIIYTTSKGQTKSRPSSQALPFKPEKFKAVSDKAQKIIDNFRTIKSHTQGIQTIFQNLQDLEVPITQDQVANIIAQNELRPWKNDRLIKHLNEISRKQPDLFMNIRDISHQAWQDHAQLERQVKNQQIKFQQRFNRLQAKYLYRNFHIKQKAGLKIRQLELKIDSILEKASEELNTSLMELNDLQSANYQMKMLEEKLLDNVEQGRVVDLPTARNQIKNLLAARRVLEKKAIFAQKTISNMSNKVNIVSKMNKELAQKFSTTKSDLNCLIEAFYAITQQSKLVDSDKEKVRNYLDKQKYQKLANKFLNGEFQESASFEYMLNKFSELRERINMTALGLKQKLQSEKLYKLLEEFKVESLLEQSEKQSFKRFVTPEQAELGPVKKSKPPVKSKTIIVKKRRETVIQEIQEKVVEEDDQEDPLADYKRIQTQIDEELKRDLAKAMEQFKKQEKKQGKKSKKKLKKKETSLNNFYQPPKETSVKLSSQSVSFAQLTQESSFKTLDQFKREKNPLDSQESKDQQQTSYQPSKEKAYFLIGKNQQERRKSGLKDLIKHPTPVLPTRNQSIFSTQNFQIQETPGLIQTETSRGNLQDLNTNIQMHDLSAQTSRKQQQFQTSRTKKTSQTMFKHHSVITRVQTPKQLKNFKQKLLNLISQHTSFSYSKQSEEIPLKAVLALPIQEQDTQALILNLIQRHFSQKLSLSTQTDKRKSKRNFTIQELSSQWSQSSSSQQQPDNFDNRPQTRKISVNSLNKLRNLKNEIYGKKPKEVLVKWARHATLKTQETCLSFLQQFQTLLHQKGLKKPSKQTQIDLMKDLLQQKVNSGLTDDISHFLRTISDPNSLQTHKHNISNLILQKNFTVLSQITQLVPHQLLPSAKRKLTIKNISQWKRLLNGLFRRFAMRLGSEVKKKPYKILDIWYLMSTYVKFIKHRFARFGRDDFIASRQKRLLQVDYQDWKFTPSPLRRHSKSESITKKHRRINTPQPLPFLKRMRHLPHRKSELPDQQKMIAKISNLASHFGVHDQNSKAAQLEKQIESLQEQNQLLKEAYSKAVDQISEAHAVDYNQAASQSFKVLVEQNQKLQAFIDVQKYQIRVKEQEFDWKVEKEEKRLREEKEKSKALKEKLYMKEVVQDVLGNSREVKEIAQENARLRIELEEKQQKIEDDFQMIGKLQQEIQDIKKRQKEKMGLIKVKFEKELADIRNRLKDVFKKEDLGMIEVAMAQVKTQIRKKLIQQENQIKQLRVMENTIKPQDDYKRPEKKKFEQIVPVIVEEKKLVQDQFFDPEPAVKPIIPIVSRKTVSTFSKQVVKQEKDELDLENFLGSSAPTRNQLAQSLNKYSKPQ